MNVHIDVKINGISGLKIVINFTYSFFIITISVTLNFYSNIIYIFFFNITDFDVIISSWKKFCNRHIILVTHYNTRVLDDIKINESWEFLALIVNSLDNLLKIDPPCPTCKQKYFADFCGCLSSLQPLLLTPEYET